MIPIVDLTDGVIENAQDIVAALQINGFVFLDNSWVSFEKVDKMFNVADQFWALPTCQKQKYQQEDIRLKQYTGYMPPGIQRLNPKNKSILSENREMFDVVEGEFGVDRNFKMPNSELPAFRCQVFEMIDHLKPFAVQLLQALENGLRMQAGTLTKIHSFGNRDNSTSFRQLHYPPIEHTVSGEERCGEHTDFGTMTMLFQDKGGLEVRNRDGVYEYIHYRPNSILLNAAECLSSWTGALIPAPKHRVLVPSNPSERNSTRKSIAYFINPNNDAQIVNLLSDEDELNSPVVQFSTHLTRLINESYGL